MASVNPIESIIEESNEKRVFYFHEFAYFVHTLDYTNPLTEDILKSYFVALLLVFEEILIPLEHITISCCPEEAGFKKNFLNSLFAKELISAGRLVTTRWSVCSDTQEHIEACDKYMHSFGAASFHFVPRGRDAVMEMRVFKRDQATQSLGTRDYAEICLGQKDRDLLRYEDGSVIIEFSVENAILGKARDKLSDPKAHRIAERAYVRAMTIGNGNIYRAAVDHVESVRHGENVLFDPLVPLEECQGVNPVLLKREFLQRILWHIRYQVPKIGCEMYICEDWKWIQGFLSYLNRSAVKVMKNTLIKALEHISLCGITSAEDFHEALQTIRPMPVNAVLPQAIVFILQYKEYMLEKFERLADGRQPVRHLVFDDTALSIFNRSLQDGWHT